MRTSRLLVLIASVLVACAPLAAGSDRAGAAGEDAVDPGAPTSVAAQPTNGGTALSWLPPSSDGGSPIISYTARVDAKRCLTAATTCTITGLHNGTRYAVTVVATNAIGTGPATAPIHVTPSSARNCRYVGPAANLQRCDLSGADLSAADLAGADLRGADLMAADLSGADLTNTGAAGANLAGASLAEADLFGASLAGADLTAAELSDAYVEGSDMAGADLKGLASGGVSGTPTVLPTRWILAGGYLVGPDADLHGADLAGVDLAGADLAGADLAKATLIGVSSAHVTGVPDALPARWELVGGYLVGPGADLVGADLRGAALGRAHLGAADLEDADLSGAKMHGAVLGGVSSAGITGAPASLPAEWDLVDGYLIGPGADLSDAALAGTHLGDDVLTGADLSGADLASAVLSGAALGRADLDGADLAGADLSGGSLADAILYDADLDNADLTGTDLSGVGWADTVCPDGSNSDGDGGSCNPDRR